MNTETESATGVEEEWKKQREGTAMILDSGCCGSIWRAFAICSSARVILPAKISVQHECMRGRERQTFSDSHVRQAAVDRNSEPRLIAGQVECLLEILSGLLEHSQIYMYLRLCNIISTPVKEKTTNKYA